MEENILIAKELQPGTQLHNGKYTIEKKIGQGGFSITYKAIQQGLNCTVCIKEYFLSGHCVRNTHARTVLLQDITVDDYEKYRAAFEAEARTLATLNHPGIVRVTDIFNENNTSYMVMSFIEGRSLQDIVDNVGPLSYAEAVNFILQITEAVGYIHKRNILHRDIKPDNIMITADNKAILIDFGSAREFQQDKTQQQTAMLTQGYAPPEQYSYKSRKGYYTDIYALGATLYFTLTGQAPLEAAARINEPLIEPIQLNPGIPQEVNQTIMKAMELNSANRHQTVQEFYEELCGLKQGQPKPKIESEPEQRHKTEPKPEPEPKPAKAPLKRSAKWLIGGLIVLVVILVGAIAINVCDHNEKTAKEELATQKDDSIAIKEYEKIIDKLNFYFQNIRNEYELYGDVQSVVRTLDLLKELEKAENKDFFIRTKKQRCYQEKFNIYIEKLKEEQKGISEWIIDREKNNMQVYPKVKEKYEVITCILAQSEGGSAIQIKLEKPKTQE